MSFIEFKKVNKIYKGDIDIVAVKDCSFEIDKGELVVILGASGAGKTTILNILGGMDSPTSGEIIVDRERIDRYNKKQLTLYRRNSVGFVFQFYNLIANLTAIENIELANKICKNAFSPEKILKQVGLKDRMNNFPSALSGGEQQRVAIARAIAKNTKLLLCDEPTGALDSNTGKKIIELLQNNCKKYGTTTIMITHNVVISQIADKVIKIKNGTVEEVVINKKPKDVNEIEW